MVATTTPTPRVRLFTNLRALRNLPGYLDEINQKYNGAVVAVEMRPRFVPYLVGDPDLVEQVWNGSREGNYGRYGMMWEELGKLQGKAGIGAEGPAWKSSRDVLQPIFTGRSVRGLIPAMAAGVGEAVENLQRKIGPSGGSVSLAKEMMQITHRVLGKTFFGERVPAEQAWRVGANIDLSFEAMQSRVAFPGLPEWIPMPGDRRHRSAKRKVDDIVYPLVERARNEQLGPDVISMLAHAKDEAGEPIDIDRVRNDVVGLFTGGTETTALTLTWVLIVLSERPDIAARVQSEVDEVIGGPGNSVQPDHLAALTYTKMVLDETLRLYPPAWMLPRGVVREDVLGGVAVKPGDNVIVSPYVTQRMKSLWEEPLSFIPERWGPDAPKRHRYAYFPFGGGVHRCIGAYFFELEAQLALATLLTRFRVGVRAPRGTRPQAGIALKPKHEVLLDLSPR